MAGYPNVPIYLFYGNQPEALLRARDAVLDAVLPREIRDENLTEYVPTEQSDKVRLSACMDEIAGDLATVSFIPGAGKCVVVTNPAELYASSGGPKRGGQRGRKSKKTEWHMTWLEKDLPQTDNHIILLAFEDEGAAREVDEQCALYRLVQKIGYTRRFQDKRAFFRLEDAILARDPAACLIALRDLWGTGKGDGRAYQGVQRTLRYLMQANIAREREVTGDPDRQSVYFPSDKRSNLFAAHPNVRRKYLAGRIYRTRELLEAYQGVLEVYRAMRPRPGDDYVPDARGLLEQVLVKLMTSPRPR